MCEGVKTAVSWLKAAVFILKDNLNDTYHFGGGASVSLMVPEKRRTPWRGGVCPAGGAGSQANQQRRERTRHETNMEEMEPDDVLDEWFMETLKA